MYNSMVHCSGNNHGKKMWKQNFKFSPLEKNDTFYEGKKLQISFLNQLKKVDEQYVIKNNVHVLIYFNLQVLILLIHK